MPGLKNPPWSVVNKSYNFRNNLLAGARGGHAYDHTYGGGNTQNLQAVLPRRESA